VEPVGRLWGMKGEEELEYLITNFLETFRDYVGEGSQKPLGVKGLDTSQPVGKCLTWIWTGESLRGGGLIMGYAFF